MVSGGIQPQKPDPAHSLEETRNYLERLNCSEENLLSSGVHVWQPKGELRKGHHDRNRDKHDHHERYD